MSLSCDCDWDFGDDDGPWYWVPNNFSTLETTRRKRCVSCKKLIDIGSDVVEFEWVRRPRNHIEEQIHFDEVPMASQFMCEHCGEIYLNLTAYNYCIEITDNMEDLLKEHQSITRFKKRK